VPRNAYLVYGDARALAQFRARAARAAHVQWEGPYLAEHKIHPLAQAALQKAAQKLEVDDLFEVQLVEDGESNASSLQFLEQVRRKMLDLVEANRQQLLAAGLPAKNIEASPLCTNCHPELLFSYRAEHGKTGRMMGAAGIRE